MIFSPENRRARNAPTSATQWWLLTIFEREYTIPKNVEAIGENQVEIRKFYFFFGGAKTMPVIPYGFSICPLHAMRTLLLLVVVRVFLLKKIWAYIFHDEI